MVCFIYYFQFIIFNDEIVSIKNWVLVLTASFGNVEAFPFINNTISFNAEDHQNAFDSRITNQP